MNLTDSKKSDPTSKSNISSTAYPTHPTPSAPAKVIPSGTLTSGKIKRGPNKQLLFPTPATHTPQPNSFHTKPIFLTTNTLTGPLSTNRFTLSATEITIDQNSLAQFLKAKTSAVKIPLSESRSATVLVDQIRSRGDHTHTIVGKVLHSPGSQVILTFHEEVVSGSVAYDSSNEHFEFANAGNGNMVVRQLDPNAFTEKCGQPDDHIKLQPQQPTAQAYNTASLS
ncbi:hypothetical protein [Rubritalea tangerina]|uniref:Uncharacterized protein n=1 Tax=Rubritalea tangerina TaxID=430798 RepID=A0ABW4ZDW1_9BACT